MKTKTDLYQYIRTKDGRIIDLSKHHWVRISCVSRNSETDTFEEDVCYQCSYFEYQGDAAFWKQKTISHNRDVIGEADSIIELLDGFIVEEIGNEKNWFTMEPAEFIAESVDKNHLKNWNYLGFLKTEKGFIYVARMNVKGELELL